MFLPSITAKLENTVRTMPILPHAVCIVQRS
jgi:hypothetical protein